MDTFENLLASERASIERFVKFRISDRTDADDVLQEVYLTAYQKIQQLRNTDSFKAWIISIARNKCNDYFRKKANQFEIPIDELTEKELSYGRLGVSVVSTVRETLELLGDKDKQVLYLSYWKEMPQADIAKMLNIPVGTVKSRLHTAKQNFKSKYPYHTNELKGEISMKKLPEFLPEYKIEKVNTTPFTVLHQELPGMFVIPKLGERITFGCYDMPTRKQNGLYTLAVTGKATIHGIDGVAIQQVYKEDENTEKSTIFAQLTDTRCKYLGGSSTDQNGSVCIVTFLDADFDKNYGISEDNCGFPTHRNSEGKIQEVNNEIRFPKDKDVSDIVGRFYITINERVYDTVRLVDFQNTDQGGMLSEYYLDQNGRTILWRRFNRDDWAIDLYKKKWSEQLPKNERITVNGKTYVHWYDCITDYIL